MIRTSTCGSVGDKRKIQNRKIQSKRVLGVTKYTLWPLDHNEVTQYFFVETALIKSTSVLIQRTISRQNQKTDTTAQVYCTLSSAYVTPKIILPPKSKH